MLPSTSNAAENMRVRKTVLSGSPHSALRYATQQLRAAGLKVTAQRLCILELLRRPTEGSAHLSAESIHDRLRQEGRAISLATVYRVLSQLEACGLVARHRFLGGHCIFEIANTDAHDHMLDVDGGAIVEFSDPIIRSRLQAIAAAKGYDVVDQEVTLYVRAAAI